MARRAMNPHTADAMNKQAEKYMRQDRFARVLSLTDRILSPKVLDVEIAEQYTGAPAWTDGETITLNATELPSLTTGGVKALAVWLGANYHELGHVLYSPRTASPLRTQVRTAVKTFAPQAQEAWNILEDQRQERLMIAQFSPLRAYFTAMGTTLLLDADDPAGAYCLLAGRTWLPEVARLASRDAFTAQRGIDATLEMDRIVGAYQRLSDTGYTQVDEAMALIVDFTNVMGGSTMPHTGCEWTSGGTKGDDDAAETDAVDTADEAPTSPEGHDDADDSDGDTGGDAQDGAPDEGADTDDDAGKGMGGDADMSDEDGDSDMNGNEGSNAGTAKDDAPIEDIDDLTDAIEDALTDMLQDEDVAKDLDDVTDALDQPLGEGAHGQRAMVNTVQATATQATEARRIEDAMRDITDASEARHLRGVEHGKVNVRRYATAQRFDPDTMFDRFEPSQEDEVSLEAVILLDRSGSMGGNRLVAASAAVWAVQQGIEAADGACTVLAYDTRHSIIQNKGERAPVKVQRPRAGGGTNPTSALVEAHRILSESDSANRILISVTDGAWAGGDKTVEALNERGVVTAMVLIDEYTFAESSKEERTQAALDYGRNGHQHVIGSAYGQDIAPLFESIATTMMEGALY